MSSILLFYLSLLLLSEEFLYSTFGNAISNKFTEVFSYYKSIVLIIVLPLIALSPDLIWRLLRVNYWPTPADILNDGNYYSLKKENKECN